VASTVVVAAAVGGRFVPRMLAWPPLVWIGLLSYGLYVVHYPLYLLLSSERTHVDGVPLLAVRLVATGVLAFALHHLVERPVRWGHALPGWQGGMALASGLGIVLVLATSLPHVGRDNVAPSELALDDRTTTVVTMPVPEVSAAPLSSPAAPAPTPTPTTAPVGASASPPATPKASGPERALRMLVVGDSTAAATGLGLQQWAADSGLAAVDVVSGPGCAFSQDGVAIMREGWTRPPGPACTGLLDAARAQASKSQPDVIVVFIGSIQIADWLYTGDTQVRAIGDPVFDARYVQAANDGLARLESLGAPVLLATLPVPNWDPTVQFPGATFPGTGPLTINDAGRAHLLDAVNRELMPSHAATRLFAYAELISEPDGSVSTKLRPDGMHLDPAEVPGLMRDGLEALLRDAYREVVRAHPSTVRPGRTIWTA
jgi:hypothetical protein